jgi:hypothetical protein
MLRKNLIALVLLDAINKEEAAAGGTPACPNCNKYLKTPNLVDWESYFNLANLGAGGWTTTVSS